MPQSQQVTHRVIPSKRISKGALVTLLVLALMLLLGVPVAAGSSETAFTITGRGWGHGIGMSQWGAYGLAKHGSSYKEILRHYYTGVDFTKLEDATVGVRLRSGLSGVRLTCAGDYTVRGSAAAYTIPAKTVATTTYANGTYRVVAGDWSRDFTASVTFAAAGSLLDLRTATDLGKTGRYRGTIKVVRSGTSLMVINNVALESYLRGVVPYEVSASWPAAALKAQACAARSYAERARRNADGAWDLYCDTRSQAYGGVSLEDPRSDDAIVATAGVVPTYKGQPIQAFYFSCSGGETENIELAWETSAVPYLKAVEDPYDSYATLHTWGPLSRTPAKLASSLGSAVKGSLLAIACVEHGKSPRIVKAAIIGSQGTTYLHGSALRTKLGLNSAWATFTSMSIAPSSSDSLSLAKGVSVTLQGRVYPALAAGAVVKLKSSVDGTWRTANVTTVRHSQKLPDGQSAKYSSYSVTATPGSTTKYYFTTGSAKSPTTTIKVHD